MHGDEAGALQRRHCFAKRSKVSSRQFDDRLMSQPPRLQSKPTNPGNEKNHFSLTIVTHCEVPPLSPFPSPFSPLFLESLYFHLFF